MTEDLENKMQKHRKLAAIMFTDIVGYTALMSKDEDNALRILQKNRDIVKLLVSQFNGELLKEMGDGNLCSFGSVVDAVNCALEIQNSLKDETEFKLRIGIHIGDVVVEEGGDVFGDGVNVASRIENLAEPGGICISDRVYYDIKNKPVLEAIFLGEKKLKNIDSPVKVYSLSRGGVPESSPKPIAAKQKEPKRVIIPKLIGSIVVVVILVGIIGYALYSRYTGEPIPVTEIEEIKSIAVLPFENISPEEEQEYFCYGLVDEIINALTHVKGLRVIARNSAFAFKGQHPDIREVGEKLDVEYILEGSVRKADSDLRISAQLIKVADHSHLWSKIYERKLKDVFDIQEDISLAVAQELKITLLGSEKAAIEKRPTDNLEAYDLYLLGRHYWEQGPMSKACDYFLQAVDMDPNFALAYTGIADFYNQMGLSYPELYPLARAAAEKAIELDDTCAEAYVSLSWSCMYYDWDLAAAENALKRAVELNPGYYLAYQWYTDCFCIQRKFPEALEKITRAEELNPQYYHAVRVRMDIYMILNRYEEAMVQLEKLKELNPKYAYRMVAS